MTKSLFWVTLVAVLVCLAAPALAPQGKVPEKPPQPAQGPSAEVLRAWNGIGRKLITMAEDFPEDKYDFKPQPPMRTFAEQVLHVAGTNYVLLSAVKGSQMGPGTEDPDRKTYKTKADVLALLKKSVDDGATVIQEIGDAGMSKTVKYPYGNRLVSANFVFMETAEHAGEHYGQLVVYYRLNGIVPPASRPRQ
ncbi:MAG TPA: DinB family protein [Candidatus Acidoferrales bacterium]|nr:DinB family protein [Candidatus Acidoferrales bacterium]